MGYEKFTGVTQGEKYTAKFVRFMGDIYTGDVNDGHELIAGEFRIVEDIKRIKKTNREEADGGFIAVDATDWPPSVCFDGSSGNLVLNLEEESGKVARRRTIDVAKKLCPEGSTVFGYGLEENVVELSKDDYRIILPENLYDRDGESFYSIK